LSIIRDQTISFEQCKHNQLHLNNRNSNAKG